MNILGKNAVSSETLQVARVGNKTRPGRYIKRRDGTIHLLNAHASEDGSCRSSQYHEYKALERRRHSFSGTDRTMTVRSATDALRLATQLSSLNCL